MCSCRRRMGGVGETCDRAMVQAQSYVRLHAKFILGTADIGFVGTSNFDDRSKLYNNEMGYFFFSAV